jgi:8-oxo-dGTP pyrophosphatase MutT (NUDIX family)
MKKSYGILLYKIINKQIKVLLVKKRFSYAFNSVIYGRQKLNIEFVTKIAPFLAKYERERLINWPLFKIWLWLFPTSNLKNIKNNIWRKKLIRSRILLIRKNKQLFNLIKNTKLIWDSPEWEIPKGNKMQNETDEKCAQREFGEETGIIIPKIKYNSVFVEEYISYDDKKYQNNLYIMKVPYDFNSNQILKTCDKYEIESVQWFNINTIMNSMLRNSVRKQTFALLIEILT